VGVVISHLCHVCPCVDCVPVVQSAALKLLAGKAAVSSASLAQRAKSLDKRRVPTQETSARAVRVGAVRDDATVALMVFSHHATFLAL
jgi:hypothetical protein